MRGAGAAHGANPSLPICAPLSGSLRMIKKLVPGRGLEPPRPLGHRPLKTACLPFHQPGMHLPGGARPGLIARTGRPPAPMHRCSSICADLRRRSSRSANTSSAGGSHPALLPIPLAAPAGPPHIRSGISARYNASNRTLRSCEGPALEIPSVLMGLAWDGQDPDRSVRNWRD